MSIELARPSAGRNLKRALFGGAASLAAFGLARMVTSFLYPMGSFPFANLALFLGTPFLLVSFVFPGVPSLGSTEAMVLNAAFWVMLGGLLGLIIRRAVLAAVAWLLVAGVLAGSAFAFVVLGMMSSGP